MPKSKTQEKPKVPEAPKTPKSKNSKNAPKSQGVSRNPTPSKQAEKESRIDDQAPEVPEFVKELKKQGGLRHGIHWQLRKEENADKNTKKRPKLVCYPFDEKYVILQYRNDNEARLHKIDAHWTETIRLAMTKAGVRPKRGFRDFDELTEVVSDSEDEAELEKMREEARRKRNEKLKRSMELKKTLVESRTKSKITTKIEKTNEFKNSYYQLAQLNERSCYYLESSKSPKLPANSEGPKASSDKTDTLVVVNSPGTPVQAPKVASGMSKKLENEQGSVNSDYVAKGLNEDSAYCRSTMKTDEAIQKTSTNSGTLNLAKSDLEGNEKKKTE